MGFTTLGYTHKGLRVDKVWKRKENDEVKNVGRFKRLRGLIAEGEAVEGKRKKEVLAL